MTGFMLKTPSHIQLGGPLGRNPRRGHKAPWGRCQFPEADALAVRVVSMKTPRSRLWHYTLHCMALGCAPRYHMVWVDDHGRTTITFYRNRRKANVGRSNDPAKTPCASKGRSGGQRWRVLRKVASSDA